MKKTAQVKQAVSILAEEIMSIYDMYATGRKRFYGWSEEQASRHEKRLRHMQNKYYAHGNAFAMLFDARFDELERAALDSKGFEHIDSAESLWSRAI